MAEVVENSPKFSERMGCDGLAAGMAHISKPSDFVPPEQQLQVISDLVRSLVAGNPIVTTEELPKWFAGFLLAMKTVDAERLSEIRQLTRELDEARRKIEVLEAQLGSEKTIVEVSSEPE